MTGDQLDERGRTGVAAEAGAAAPVVTHPPALRAVTITVGRGLVRSGTRGVPRFAGAWGPVLREPNRRKRARTRRLWRGTRGRERDAKITMVGLSFRRKHTIIPFLSEKGFCMLGDQCPFDHGVDPVVIGNNIPHTYPPPPSMVGIPSLALTKPGTYSHPNSLSCPLQLYSWK